MLVSSWRRVWEVSKTGKVLEVLRFLSLNLGLVFDEGLATKFSAMPHTGQSARISPKPRSSVTDIRSTSTTWELGAIIF